MDFVLDVKDIMISDPYILAVPEEGLYYMYSQFVPGYYADTNRPNGIFAYASQDLIHWTMPYRVFDGNDIDFWGKYDF